MADKRARYFFSWGLHREHGDGALRDALMTMANAAFAEDKVMIEAQQRVIEQFPQGQTISTVHDRGATLFNRLVERLARSEVVDDRSKAA